MAPFARTGCLSAMVVGLLFSAAAAEPLSSQQREQLAEAKRLSENAAALAKAGNYTDATEPARKALELRKAVLGADHPDYLTELSDLGKLYYEAGDYARSQEALLAALAGQQKHQPEHAATALTLHRLGYLQREQGRFPAAKQTFEQALALRKKLLGPDHPDTAATLSAFGSLLRETGNYTEAHEQLQRALAIRRRVLGDAHPDTAWTLGSLGILYQLMGDYERARKHYEEALAVRRRIGEDLLDTAYSLFDMGHFSQAVGDYVHAQAYHEKALAIRKARLGDGHPLVAATLSDLGELFYLKGDYAKAEPYLTQALALRRAIVVEHRDTALALHRLGTVYRDMGDFGRSRARYEEALAIRRKVCGPEHPDTATTLNALGSLLRDHGEYNTARKYLDEALAIRRKVLGENHSETAWAIGSLALLEQKTGDLDNSLRHYLEALAIRQRVLGPGHRETAWNIDFLGQLHMQRGEYVLARKRFEEALQIREQVLGLNHPRVAASKLNLALLSAAEGKSEQAEQLSRDALAIHRKHLHYTAAIQSERQQLIMSQSLRNYLDVYLSLTSPHPRPGAPSYEYVLAWKGSVFMRQLWLHERRQLLRESRDPEEVALQILLEDTARRLAALAFAGPATPEGEDLWRDQIRSLREDKEELEQQLARLGTSRSGQMETGATPADLQRVLPADAALVDIIEYQAVEPPDKPGQPWKIERRLAAFVVRRDRPVLRRELGALEPITRAIEQWRLTIGKRAWPVVNADDPALLLRRQLWEPLEKHLDGVKTLLISPDGALARFPFAALPGRDEKKYLIEEMAVAVVPVPQLLAERRTAMPDIKDTDPSLLVVGNVEFGPAPATPVPGAQVWKALPATRGEVLTVRDLFEERFAEEDGLLKHPVVSLRGRRATTASLRAQAGKHRWLHVATHGFFSAPGHLVALSPAGSRSGDALNLLDSGTPLHPGLMSGLVLAGANLATQPGASNGILTALEVAELDLSHVELAVLSACETGLGEVQSGEGTLGLARAFQVAGARGVVASLWSVDDDATRKLMEVFYSRLWDKAHPLGKLEALRAAQLEMLKEGYKRGMVREDLDGDRTKQVPPVYWAAFMLSGDWR